MQRRLVQVPVVVPLGEPTVQSIVKTNRALRISPSSPLGKASVVRTCNGCTMAGTPLGNPLRLEYLHRMLPRLFSEAARAPLPAPDPSAWCAAT